MYMRPQSERTTGETGLEEVNSPLRERFIDQYIEGYPAIMSLRPDERLARLEDLGQELIATFSPLERNRVEESLGFHLDQLGARLARCVGSFPERVESGERASVMSLEEMRAAGFRDEVFFILQDLIAAAATSERYAQPDAPTDFDTEVGSLKKTGVKVREVDFENRFITPLLRYGDLVAMTSEELATKLKILSAELIGVFTPDERAQVEAAMGFKLDFLEVFARPSVLSPLLRHEFIVTLLDAAFSSARYGMTEGGCTFLSRLECLDRLHTKITEASADMQ